MSDGKETEGLIKQLLSFIPEDGKEMIGVYLMVFIPMGIVFGFVYLPQYLEKLSESSEKCWELQEVKDKTYKVNTCTGEHVLIDGLRE